MALLFCDSFDHYTNVIDKWTQAQVEGVGGAINIGAGGRNLTNCLSFQAGQTGPNNMIRKVLPVNYVSLIAGGAFKIAGGLVNDEVILAFDEQTGVPAEQISVRWNSNLNKLYVSVNGVQQKFSTLVMLLNVYYYVELKATIDPVAGSYELRINNATVAIDSNINTRGKGSNNFANALRVGGNVATGYPGTNLFLDDLYLCDTSGVNNNTFLGDIRIQLIRPTGPGATAAWTPVGAAANWNCVQEVPNDGDTTYLSGTVAGTRDTYVTQDLSPVAGSIKGIQANIVARKDDAGARSVQTLVRQAGVNYDIGTVANLGVGYILYSSVQELNPATGLPFTIAEVNADEWGLDLIT